MSDRKLAFIYSPEIEGLSYPADCPFKAQRTGLTRHKLISFGLLGGTGRDEVPARKATLAELNQLHSAHYLSELQRAAAGDLSVEGFRMGLGGPDTPVFKDMFEYSAWASGAALTASDLLLAGKADIAFNLLGGLHHAHTEHAGGFCFLNDVALACLHLAAAGKRVACVDVDAHHGDGTQDFFYRRNDVLTISVHESGKTLYPWGGFENEAGEGPGVGYNVNVPLPAGTFDKAFLGAFGRVVVPLLGAYQPDVIVLELGMDILAGDPLTHLHMTNNVVVDVLDQLLKCGCYHVENTVRGWALAWRTGCGESETDIFSLGLGGVMLGNTDWAGGLRDRELPVTAEQRAEVEPELRATIDRVIQNIFPRHGLGTQPNRRAAAGG